MGESFLNRIIQSGSPTPPTPSGYVRLAGVPDGESIIANAPVIENEGTNYYPIYYMCLMDMIPSRSFAKTGTGLSTGADAFVFSDEPSTLYVGTTTHAFDVADDYTTSENWKCRYVIAYATEANKDNANGITVNVHYYKDTIEFIGSQYLKLSSSSAVSGANVGTSGNQNLRYVNLSNSSFYNNTISAEYFCGNASSLETILLPDSVTDIGNNFCIYCYALTSISLPNVTTIGNYFLRESGLTSISLPNLTTVGSGFCDSSFSLATISLPNVATAGGRFCYKCYSLTTISLPELTTATDIGYYCTSLTSLSLPKLTSISADFCRQSYALTTLYIPSVTEITGNFFQSCYALEYFEILSTVTTITDTSIYTLDYVQFIKLPTDFDIDACNFTGATGYTKSLAWFTHLAAQLKDNSAGDAKTMVLGAANIALIPAATATIIANKNWTLS